MEANLHGNRWKLSWRQMKPLNETTSMATSIEVNGSSLTSTEFGESFHGSRFSSVEVGRSFLGSWVTSMEVGESSIQAGGTFYGSWLKKQIVWKIGVNIAVTVGSTTSGSRLLWLQFPSPVGWSGDSLAVSLISGTDGSVQYREPCSYCLDCG